MNLKVALFLLCNLCCLCSGKATTTADYDYPCKSDNSIVFFYDNSLALDAHKYQKQTNFLVNHTFEKWTSFDNLHLMSYRYRDPEDHHFDSKSDVQDFIIKDLPIEARHSMCYMFREIYAYQHLSVLYFLREFNQRDVQEYGDDCYTAIQGLDSRILTFILLTDEVVIDELKAYFPRANIVREEQFYNGYGCNPKIKTTGTTLLRTTTENPNDVYPCTNKIGIAYDRSNKLSKENFKKLQDFLIEYVFQNWTNLENLNLYSYARSYELFDFVKSKAMLESFILNGKQVDDEPDVFSMIRRMESETNSIIFKIDYDKFFLTFVIMSKNVSINSLMSCYPQAQFITWNIEEEDTPQNWERAFMDAYRCSQLKKQEQSIYPCNNRVLIGFDERVDTALINGQKDFLFKSVFTTDWIFFDDLALIAYSENMRMATFGTIKTLEDVHSFINNIQTTTATSLMSTKTTLSTSTQKPDPPVSLCKVFYELLNVYLLDTNIVLFIDIFHDQIVDECPSWLQHVQNSANSITLVVLNKQVNTNYLYSKFPQAKIIPWNTATNAPDYWDNTVFGCENLYFDPSQHEYPCGRTLAIGYDISRYLNLISYQRLTKFLTTKVFIKQWTSFDPKLSLFTFPNSSHINPNNLIEARFFIRQTSQTTREPSFCNVFNDDDLSGKFVILFISKVDEKVLPKECIQPYSKAAGLTFVSLTSMVNTTLLNQTFPTAKVVEWNITNDYEPKDWPTKLWRAFDCQGPSPIILPHNTSTVMPSTKHSTSGLSSTTLTSTPKSSTSTLITTTTPHSQTPTKSSDSGGSQERAILLGIFIPLLIIFLLGFIACFCFYRRKQRQQLVENIASNNHYKSNKAFNEDREEDQWEISLECLQINFLDKLGSGAFGDVYLGKINGPAPIKCIYNDSPHCQRFNNCEVAIKSLPSMQVDEYARSEFWKEIEFMKNLKFHQNLVCFLGYVYDPTSPLMLLEYCSNGDLLKFIKTNKQKFVESFEINSDCKALLSFAWQISSGLEYLSSLDLIHRDIAARNILLDSQNVCKVSDFGLCRLAEDLTYQSKGGKLPIRWMAIESLKDYVYSQKTDVWSYGVLLFELFTLGDLPYVHVENILAFIESDKRLDKPNYCSEEVYELMLSCWLVDPEERPTFAAIYQILSKMLETSTMHYNYVDTLALIEEANQIDDLNGEYDEITV